RNYLLSIGRSFRSGSARSERMLRLRFDEPPLHLIYLPIHLQKQVGLMRVPVMSNCSGKKERFFNLAILAGLALIELCCFGGAIEHSGLYLDDWQMICQLHFGPQSFLEATGSLLSVDPRVAIRPVEAPYFALLYLLFGIQPIAYHVVNAVTEVLAAWFLCLSVNSLTGSRFLSAAAALAFLLYPAHDSTHYWIVASSVTLSGLLYLISLWLSVCGAADGNTRLHWLSGLA